jgi:glycosyltransferase involved in cell wall biosynthesis
MRVVRRLKVAMPGQYPEDREQIVGGVEAVVATLADEMARRPEIELHVLRCTTRVAEPTREERGDLIIHWLPRRRLGRATFHVREVAELRSCLAQIQPHVVHAHGTGLYAGAALAGAWPSVITVHGIVCREARVATGVKDRVGWELDARYERRVLARARHIISISPYVQQEFCSLTQAQLHLIENPISDAFFAQAGRGEPGRILFAGRVIPRKDPLAAIRAFEMLCRAHPRAQLRIAGEMDADPGYAGQARALVRDLGLSGQVHFLGQLNEDEILREYRDCALVLLSSVQETAPVVIEQAMAAGKPVVTTDAGGCGALITDGETGFVAPVGDVAGLARGLLRLVDDPDLYARMSVEAARQAGERFKASSVVDKTLYVYHMLRNN